MNVPLIAAGSLATLAAAVHGGAGEALVVSKLSHTLLPPTRFGGPRTTKTMIHVTWHLTTVGFLGAGTGLLLAGSVLDGDTARGIGLVAAGTVTGFAAVTIALGAAPGRWPRALYRHPAPILLTATAALAWWGAL